MFAKSRQKVETSMQPTTHIATPLTMYLDCAYFMLLSPYRLKWKETRFVLHSWWPQKLICFAITVISLLWTLLETADWFRKGFTKKTYYFFILAYGIFGNLLKLVTWKALWLHGRSFCEIANHSISRANIREHLPQNHNPNQLQRKRNITRLLSAACVVLYMLAVVVRGIQGTNTDTYRRLAVWTWKWWWCDVVQHFRYYFFIDSQRNRGPCEYGALNTFLGVIGLFGVYGRLLVQLYRDFIPLITALMVWKAASASKEMLKLKEVFQEDLLVVTMCTYITNKGVTTESQQSEVKAEYEYLKRLLQLVSNNLGAHFLIQLPQAVLYLSICLDVVFLRNISDVPGQICSILFIAVLLAGLLLTAEIHRMMEYFNTILSTEMRNKRISFEEAYFIMDELNNDALSIKAANIFPVTFSTLAELFGIAVTYFLLCIVEKY